MESRYQVQYIYNCGSLSIQKTSARSSDMPYEWKFSPPNISLSMRFSLGELLVENRRLHDNLSQRAMRIRDGGERDMIDRGFFCIQGQTKLMNWAFFYMDLGGGDVACGCWKIMMKERLEIRPRRWWISTDKVSIYQIIIMRRRWVSLYTTSQLRLTRRGRMNQWHQVGSHLIKWLSAQTHKKHLKNWSLDCHMREVSSRFLFLFTTHDLSSWPSRHELELISFLIPSHLLISEHLPYF